MEKLLVKFEDGKKYRFSPTKYNTYYKEIGIAERRGVGDFSADKPVLVCTAYYGLTIGGLVVRPQWCEEVPE